MAPAITPPATPPGGAWRRRAGAGGTARFAGAVFPRDRRDLRHVGQRSELHLCAAALQPQGEMAFASIALMGGGRFAVRSQAGIWPAAKLSTPETCMARETTPHSDQLPQKDKLHGISLKPGSCRGKRPSLPVGRPAPGIGSGKSFHISRSKGGNGKRAGNEPETDLETNGIPSVRVETRWKRARVWSGNGGVISRAPRFHRRGRTSGAQW